MRGNLDGVCVEKFITSTVLKIEEVYSGRYKLELPWFQRAYGWGEMHVGRLVKDLFEASAGPHRRYSIGHMAVAKPGPGAAASLVDGHQRSISLTMLCAILRDLLVATPMADRLHLLIEDADGGGYRLSPQPGVAEFFADFVQKRGATALEVEGDIMDCSPNERNIVANRDHMRAMLTSMATTPEALVEIASFLLERCVLIVDELADEEEAWALITREEERGLSPHSSELAKVTLVTAMPPVEQEAAGRAYERAQSLLNADNLSHLLCHLRTLKVRKRSAKPVDRELIQQFNLQDAGLSFLENELLPKAELMARLIEGQIGSGEALQQISRSLAMLARLDNQLWMAPALFWLEKMGDDHAQTPLFFARLDRLAYLMKIASVDPTDQEHRYIELIEAIERKRGVDRMEPLAIERHLLSAALENLRSKTFYAKRFHSLVLRRISCILAPDRDPGPVDGRRVTVEHVLPRKPDPGQQWLKDFKNAAGVANYCNRIGNLAFLTLEMNNLAANKEFLVKRFILAQSAAAFVLAENASNEAHWTRETIERRGEELIAILFEPWQLSH